MYPISRSSKGGDGDPNAEGWQRSLGKINAGAAKRFSIFSRLQDSEGDLLIAFTKIQESRKLESGFSEEISMKTLLEGARARARTSPPAVLLQKSRLKNLRQKSTSGSKSTISAHSLSR